MDDVLIIKGPLADAQSDLNAFENLARDWWPLQGYPVDDAGVIPRNAASGDPDYTAQRTVGWDILREAPDGEYYWSSPTSDPRFYLWKEYLVQTGYRVKCAETIKFWEDDAPEYGGP